MLPLCCGVVFSFTMVITPKNPQTILVRVTLNEILSQYQLSAILLERSYVPVRVVSSSGRKRLCRYLNYLNSTLSYGAYFIDPDSGKVGFRINPFKRKKELKELLRDNVKLNALVNEDIQIMVGSLVVNIPLITRVYSHQQERQ